MLDAAPILASARIAVGSTLICLLIGLPIARILAARQKNRRSRAFWEGLVALPLVLPPTVLGYYLLTLLSKTSRLGELYHSITGTWLVFTWQGAAFAVSLVSLPLLVRTAQISFAAIDPEILDAARIDGAGELAIFRGIQLPIARPGVSAGVSLAFARALGDFGVTLMVGGNIASSTGTHTMSLAVYDSMNAGDNRTAGMFVILLSVISLACSIAASALAQRSET